MPIQKTITFYSFSELSKEVQDKLISFYEADDRWDDPIIEMIEQEAEDMGIENFDLRYSGFWSQGDGLSFTGSLSRKLIENIYSQKINNERFDPDLDDCIAKIERLSSHYVHNKTVLSIVEDVKSVELTRILEQAIDEWKDEKCEYWYNLLKECYETQTSEDFIREHYEDCGYVFTSDGDII